MTSPADVINGIVGKPYRLGAEGPDEFDCYSCTAAIQLHIFGRIMPKFAAAATSGRTALAVAITVNPERNNWVETSDPTHGSIVTMARNVCGYHLGTYLDIDGGVIAHAIEECGVVVDTMTSLTAIGWRRFRFHVPALRQ